MDPAGLVTTKSAFGPRETLDRLKGAIVARGMTTFAHVDHAAGATQAGMTLRPTDLLIFGAAKGGTPLMQEKQSIGIDLPLKALVWQDASGATWLSYNDPGWLAERHGLAPGAPQVEALRKGLMAVAATATEEGGP